MSEATRLSRNRRPARFRALAFAAFLASGCGDSEQSRTGSGRDAAVPPASVDRLLERTLEAAITWPATGEDRPKSARRSWLGATRRHTGRLTMVPNEFGASSRATLLAPAGSSYRFTVELPAAPVLRIGLGYTPPPAEESPTAHFKIWIERPEAAQEAAELILDETFDMRAAGDWQDHEIDLGLWARQTVTLVLERADSETEAAGWAGWSAPEILDRGAEKPGWDVLLIVLDTLRADRLGVYGYPRATSPNLDAFAEAAIRFEYAISQSPWTNPSHRAIFRGLHPVSTAGMSSPPLAEMLWRAGYRTEALTGGGQVDSRFGFARGFESYRNADWIRDVDSVADHLLKDPGRRRFSFLHTYEAHDPYIDGRYAVGGPVNRVDTYFDKDTWTGVKRNLSDAEKGRIGDLYDGDVAFADEQLGHLFERLAADGILDRSIVIITSDHGEQFWEHGSWRHGQGLYDHQLRVPLIIHLPPPLAAQVGARVPRVVAGQVRLIDIYPTVLDLLGIPLEHDIQGRSLAPLLRAAGGRSREAFAETTNLKKTECKGLRTGRYKLILTFQRGADYATDPAARVELYDLEDDPGEQHDLTSEMPELAATLETRLREIVSGEAADAESAEPEVLDPDLQERLRALGYVG